MIKTDEKLVVSMNMQTYGGSFVRALGEALSHADHINQLKIKNAFPDEWKLYLNWRK